MQEQQLPQPKQELNSAQILQIIKKKPFTQSINGVQYTFSILSKKQQTFILSNDRFLCLKGIESISYARQFPQNTQLPFTDQSQLPSFKATYPLSEIEKYDNEQEKLTIFFSGEKKVKWEFTCPTKVSALQWKKKLQFSIQLLSEFNSSKFQKMDDFMKAKNEAAQMQQLQHQNEVNSFLNLSQSNVNTIEDRKQYQSVFLLNNTARPENPQITLTNPSQNLQFDQKSQINNSQSQFNQHPQANNQQQSHINNQQSHLGKEQLNNPQQSNVTNPQQLNATNPQQSQLNNFQITQTNNSQQIQANVGQSQFNNPQQSHLNNQSINGENQQVNSHQSQINQQHPQNQSNIQFNSQINPNLNTQINVNQSNLPQTPKKNQNTEVMNEGKSNINVNANIGGANTLNSNINVGGNINVGSNINANGNVNMGNSVNVGGNVNSGSNIKNNGNANINMTNSVNLNNNSSINVNGNLNSGINMNVSTGDLQGVNSSKNNIQSSNLMLSSSGPQNNPNQSKFAQGNIIQNTTNQIVQSTIPAQVQSNRPVTVLYNGSTTARVEDLISDGNSPVKKSFLNKSMSSISFDGKEQIRNQIMSSRRNWIEELLGGEEESELIIEFENYVEKVVEVLVEELYISQESKIFPAHQYTREYASYMLEDVYIELYFFSEEHLQQKHARYKNAVLQFKNMEYLLSSTKNQGPLKIPFMILFEFKGFLGMAKSKVSDNSKAKNKELCDILDRREFQESARISVETLMNQAKCKIVSYEKKTSLSKISINSQRVYFVQKLTQLLPVESGDKINSNHNILRAEFIQDEEFEDTVFRDKNKQPKFDKVSRLIDEKINFLVKVLENEEQYFTNSKELAELIHFYGLNIRHLGIIYRKVSQKWLKTIIQAEIAARSLKNFFRFDMQNCVMQQADRISKKQKQQQKQKRRVISFLNVLFGNTQSTFRMWRSINAQSNKYYNVTVWQNDFSEINNPYFLQALQSNLKIILNQRIHDKSLFTSMNSFDESDFSRFKFDFNIYNLDFTNTFQLIHECIEQQSYDSFHNLCEILTKQTSTKVPYLQLLKKHPIRQRINQFLLNFTSPQQSKQLYTRIENSFLPTKFLYESKLAEIKWYLKQNKHENVSKPATFMGEHAKKWLGQIHPIFTQLNRLLAEYYSEHQYYYAKALKHAKISLEMQQAIFGGDNNHVWRDYFLIGKIHYLNNHQKEALPFLTQAKHLVKVQKLTQLEGYSQLCLMLAKGYLNNKSYKQSYIIVKELYQKIKEERDEKSLQFIIEAVAMIKQLLEMNQQHQSYYRFVESDFSNIVYAFADSTDLLKAAIKMVAIPYLKNVILQKSKNKLRLIKIIQDISKIQQTSSSSLSYIKSKIVEGTFPKTYLQYLKVIDEVVDEIVANQMLDRWNSFNKMANQTLLDKIGNSQINRGFEFLANMTALFSILGQQVLEELFIMEK